MRITSKRPRDKRNLIGGVSITTYYANDAEQDKIRFLFSKIDNDRIPFMVAPEVIGDRIYFHPDEQGFSVTSESDSVTSRRFAMELTDEYKRFVGKYRHLEFDEQREIYYVDVNNKISSIEITDDETVTLTKSDYDKIMQLVKAFS